MHWIEQCFSNDLYARVTKMKRKDASMGECQLETLPAKSQMHSNLLDAFPSTQRFTMQNYTRINWKAKHEQIPKVGVGALTTAEWPSYNCLTKVNHRALFFDGCQRLVKITVMQRACISNLDVCQDCFRESRMWLMLDATSGYWRIKIETILWIRRQLWLI